MFNKKSKVIITRVIVVILVLTMVVPVILSVL